MDKGFARAAVRALAAAALLAGPALAATGGQPRDKLPPGTPPAEVLAAWNGVWVIADSFMDKQDGTSVATGGGRPNPKATRGAQRLEEPAFKGEYLKRALARKAEEDAADAAGKPLPPSASFVNGCGHLPFSGQWMTPYATELTLGPTRMILFQEAWEQVRHIYLDGRPHPDLADYDYQWKGHSVGHWEGDTLVIDTVGIKAETSFYSPKMHVVERMRLTGPDNMTDDVVIEDPDALAHPRKLHYELRRKAGMETMDYDCEENNRNPVDASGHTQTILQTK